MRLRTAVKDVSSKRFNSRVVARSAEVSRLPSWESSTVTARDRPAARSGRAAGGDATADAELSCLNRPDDCADTSDAQLSQMKTTRDPMFLTRSTGSINSFPAG